MAARSKDFFPKIKKKTQKMILPTQYGHHSSSKFHEMNIKYFYSKDDHGGKIRNLFSKV